MDRRKELSTTEKLLDLIRAGDDHDVPPRRESNTAAAAVPPAAAAPARDDAPRAEQKSCPPRPPLLSPSRWSELAAKLPVLRRRGRPVTVGISLRPDALELAVVGHVHGRQLLQDHQSYSVKQEAAAGAPDSDDSWLDSAAMQEALRRALAVVQAAHGGSAQPLEIWTELPWHHVDVHLLTIPPVATSEVANAVFWAARKNIDSFDPKNQILDFVLRPAAEADNDGKRRAVVFLAPRAVVERLRQLFRALSFPLAGITAPSSALRNLCLQERLSGGDRAFSLLRLEENSSFISLFRDCGLVFSRDIKTGLQSILEVGPAAMANGGEIELSRGETAPAGADPELQAPGEWEEGVLDEPAVDPATAGPEGHGGAELPFDPQAATRLVRQLERTFDYCQANLGIPRPERIYVASPMKLGASLLEKIEDELGIGCAWLDPFANDQGCGPLAAAPPYDQFARQLLAPAIGLAHCNRRHSLNFLLTYPDKEKQQLAHRTNQAVVGLFIVLALGLAGLYGWQQSVIGEREREYAALEQERRQLAATQYDEAYLAALAAEIGRYQDEITAMARRQQLLMLLTEVQELAPSGVALLALQARGLAGADENGLTLELRGVIGGRPAERDLQLVRYLRRLEGSQQVRTVGVTQREERETTAQVSVLYFHLEVEARLLFKGEQSR
ncbi:hypothetical protein [Desulfurivibrio dismutans]|uniref:hypothetical protein n=1 Tax=Desulfurivibrio dismutans TaxID=1398908 RepID=UPI0023DC1C8A|nr:hypothetical protein [Desulfurivibrio alkaliphilus]MDF1615447.1 hypothetical protein [Desulfurivibrio alkaliphilus]